MKLQPPLIPPWPCVAGIAGTFSRLPHADFQQQPRAAGIETYGYTWNSPDQDMKRALAHRPIPARGEAAYKVCKGCHKADGAGLADADYPQLAGQHASVIIKQMMDIRAGRRDNPRMYPFAGDWIVSAEEIADIAAYLNKCRPPPATAKATATICHAAKPCTTRTAPVATASRRRRRANFYPMVAGQHFSYLKRETRESRDHGRRNASPEMVKCCRATAMRTWKP
jgi:cytochrome c553